MSYLDLRVFSFFAQAALESLVERIRLDDRLVLALSSASLVLPPLTCTVPNIPHLLSLQLAGAGLLQSIFAHYNQHRQPIIDDIFLVMLKLPTGKKHLRTFRLHHFDKVRSRCL